MATDDEDFNLSCDEFRESDKDHKDDPRIMDSQASKLAMSEQSLKFERPQPEERKERNHHSMDDLSLDDSRSESISVDQRHNSSHPLSIRN